MRITMDNRKNRPKDSAGKPFDSGFSTIELLMVIAIMMILIGILSIGSVEILDKSRKENALKGISAVFRNARQGALTTNQPRRVVLEISYSGQASSHQEAYELGPILEFWIEKKQVRNRGWQDNYEPVNSPNEMPPGVTLVDINGRGILPDNVANGRRNRNGTFSYFTSFVINSKGRITEIQRETRSPTGNGDVIVEPVLTNLALHFMFGNTQIDLSEAVPPGEVLDYLSFINYNNMIQQPAPELNQIVTNARSDPTSDQEIMGRTQMHTLYLLRLTGQAANYDYGIYAPWPISPVPESLEGPA